jgi:hypothetical protein
MNYLNWNLSNNNNKIRVYLHIGNHVVAEKIVEVEKELNIAEKIAFREAHGGQGVVSFEYL